MKKVFNIIFTVGFWVSLLTYFLPWIAGLYGLKYGSGESMFDSFKVYGWDAFTHAFTFLGFFAGIFIISPALLYQIIYLICNRNSNIKRKVIIWLILLFATIIVYYICHKHFLTIDLEQFRL